MHTEAAIGAPQHVQEKGGNLEPPRCRIRNLGGCFLDRPIRNEEFHASRGKALSELVRGFFALPAQFLAPGG